MRHCGAAVKAKLGLLLALPLLLLGCATTNLEITDRSQPLGLQESIVLTRIKSSEGRLILSRGGAEELLTLPGTEYARTISLKDGDNLLALRLKAGQRYGIHHYYLKGFTQVVAIFKSPRFYFQPLPGTMTYIGDIVVEPDFSKGYYTGVRIGVADNENETVGLLRQKYHGLFEKYPYKKSLATRDSQ